MKKESTQKKQNTLIRLRLWIYRMISVKVVGEKANQLYDVVTVVALLLNLTVMFLSTYDNLAARYGAAFSMIEAVTTFVFALDFILRLVTARFLYPKLTEAGAMLKYTFSFTGIVDLLSFLPYYLPVFFPKGAAVFRMFRVARILRLFRINAYYDSLNVITEVISSKKQQLLSSVFIIVILMLASSLCMYSVEHQAQPNVFQNAFSGIWWSTSTLLTVGYGDIYPVTTMGKFLGILISFLGVGMVAIPTGIISAGFVEQYSILKKAGEMANDEDIRFVKIQLEKRDPWVGKTIAETNLPHDLMITLVIRGDKHLIPGGDLKLQNQDILVVGAYASKKTGQLLNMKEVMITQEHPWKGHKIRELGLARQTFIVMVKRRGKTILPDGELVLMESDKVYLYSKSQIQMAAEDYQY